MLYELLALRSYLVEDTPAVFSGNSSLSELSVTSGEEGENPEADDALLDECINSAIPKSKPKRRSSSSSKGAKKQSPASNSGEGNDDNQPKNVKVPQPNAKTEWR